MGSGRERKGGEGVEGETDTKLDGRDGMEENNIRVQHSHAHTHVHTQSTINPEFTHINIMAHILDDLDISSKKSCVQVRKDCQN